MLTGHSLAGRTVLIVEDAYLIALEAQRMAEEAGAERVVLASSVEDVRTLLAGEPKIDICVLDLKLGEEDASPSSRNVRSAESPSSWRRGSTRSVRMFRC